MSALTKYRLARLGNFTFRLVVPAVAAAIIWGLFKESSNMTWIDQVAGGTFVIIILAFAEIKDYIRKTLEQMKIDKQVSFMKNRAVTFLLMALILLMVKMFADKAIDFFLIAGLSNVIAYYFELMVAKQYRILNPRESGE